MKIPISKRLAAVAGLISEGARVADIGCDHGLLGIYLIDSGKCPFVIASDLRELPLQSARDNAIRYKTADKMEFVCNSGLRGIDPDKVDTVVCCGMGGDLIVSILDEAPWVKRVEKRLILQPQSGLPDLRQYLADQGFEIEREIPVEDHGFLYSALLLRYTGIPYGISAGERFLSAAMLRETSPLVKKYWERMVNSVCKTLASFEHTDMDAEKKSQFLHALEDLRDMEEKLK